MVAQLGEPESALASCLGISSHVFLRTEQLATSVCLQLCSQWPTTEAWFVSRSQGCWSCFAPCSGFAFFLISYKYLICPWRGLFGLELVLVHPDIKLQLSIVVIFWNLANQLLKIIALCLRALISRFCQSVPHRLGHLLLLTTISYVLYSQPRQPSSYLPPRLSRVAFLGHLNYSHHGLFQSHPIS